MAVLFFYLNLEWIIVVTKIKRLKENQLTDYFWKDSEIAYCDKQFHYNDGGTDVVLPDKEYVNGTIDEKVETSTNTIMSTVPSIINAIVSEALSNAISDAKYDFLSSAYPIGSIYISVIDVDPVNFFGGRWVRWGSGKMPVSYDANNPNFCYPEQTGGAQSVTLTQDNMPMIEVPDVSGGNFSSYLRSDAMTVGTIGNSYGWNIHNGSQISPATKTVGEYVDVDIMNPYITCFMWKRVE